MISIRQLRWFAAVVLMLGVLPAARPVNASAARVAVTQCGQVIPRGTDAELNADLDCSASLERFMVTIEGGSFFLNGHTLTGNSTLPPPPTFKKSIVNCLGDCRIHGPGTLIGGRTAIGSEKVQSVTEVPFRGATVRVNNITLRDNYAGIGGRRVIAKDCSITGGGAIGGQDGARVNRCILLGDGTGVGVISFGGRGRVKDSYVSGYGVGIGFLGGRGKVVNTIISGNGDPSVLDGSVGADPAGFGVAGVKSLLKGARLKIVGSTITDNGGVGIADARLRLVRSTVTGNADMGIFSFKSAVIRDSVVDNNCQNLANPASTLCTDISNCQKPRLSNVQCGTSGDACGQVTWRLCRDD